MSMCVEDTPVMHYPQWGLYVKREDLCCPVGPHFSKTRGVYAHLLKRPEKIIGVLDTAHSQGGWAVAQACAILGKQCILYYPIRKSERGLPLKPQQEAALKLGAHLTDLQAGRSAVLYHQAKKDVLSRGGYMYPNALKLPETVEETKREFMRTRLPMVNRILVSASSGTIAAGVLAGIREKRWNGQLIIHMGYSRSEEAVSKYIEKMTGAPVDDLVVSFVNEGYAYADTAREGDQAPFPCNEYYDLKAFRFWTRYGRGMFEGEEILLWNIG